MVIAMPMSKGFPVLVQQGQNFTAKLILDGKVYQFNSTLLHKVAYPLPVWEISLPKEWTKIQQRAFVRIRTTIPAKLKTYDPASLQFSEPISVLSRDLSGGGMQIVSKHSIEQGTKVQLEIELPDTGPLTFNGQVVRSEQSQTSHSVFWVGIKFQDMSERERSKIIRYIFKKQLDNRQKGL